MKKGDRVLFVKCDAVTSNVDRNYVGKFGVLIDDNPDLHRYKTVRFDDGHIEYLCAERQEIEKVEG